jgi:hypothetical protein
MDDWIKKSHLGCKTCRQSRKPPLADVLDNLSGFKVHIQNGVPGAEKVLDQLSSGYNKAKGANWVMEYSLTRNPIAFEEEVLVLGEKVIPDIVELLPNGKRKYFECKNWANNSTSGDFVNQMTKYFHEIDNLDQLEYVFKTTSGGGFKPNKEQLRTILKKHKKFFREDQWTKYEQVFQFNSMDIPEGEIGKLIDHIVDNKFDDIIK